MADFRTAIRPGPEATICLPWAATHMFGYFAANSSMWSLIQSLFSRYSGDGRGSCLFAYQLPIAAVRSGPLNVTIVSLAAIAEPAYGDFLLSNCSKCLSHTSSPGSSRHFYGGLTESANLRGNSNRGEAASQPCLDFRATPHREAESIQMIYCIHICPCVN